MVEKEPRRGDPDKMDRLFIMGLGYSGLAIARAALARGMKVTGTVTTPEKAADLTRNGIDAEVYDGTQPLTVDSACVICTAPAPTLPAFKDVPWFGYLSTTGVYGDRGGGWVDETTEPTPMQPRSAERLATEKQWQALGPKVAILRLPGIYGPGRSAIDQVRSGSARRIDKPGQFFSRIHVEDIASVTLTAMEKRASGVFNVTDDEPASNADVVAHAFELLGQPVPPAIPWAQASQAMTPMARSFYAESRRVRNDKIKRELGVVLKYPTYRDGLAAILRAR
jgi:nucleoside-diphosphate-sugar epimerase